jgi:anti-repressor protein
VNALIKINLNTERPTVLGRELHEFLEVKTAYKDWFPRMAEYGFTESLDFSTILSESTGGRPATDHQLTIDMAKEIAMLQRNEKGKQARQYFIDIEKEFNSPERVMARALKIADQQINSLKVTNSQLVTVNAIMQPKAEYFDELVDRNLLTSFRDTAKQLKIKENSFIGFLIEHKYIYRDKKEKLMPYADKNNGIFELKETFNEKTNWSGIQTLITPKGRETFRLLYIQANKN